MSLNLVVSLLGEEGVPRRPLWVPNVKQPVAAIRRVIEAMFNESFQKQRKRTKNCSSLRLFFNGHELEDGFSMEHYDLADGNVIQVQRKITTSEDCSSSVDLSTLSPSPLSNNHHKQQQTSKQMTSDLFYCLNDHIDALDDDTGAWFPATITSIFGSLEDINNSHTYLVTFRKPSLGSNVLRSLSQIRPPSSKPLNSFEKLNPGQAVLVLVESTGHWQVGLIEQTIRDLRYSKKKAAGGGKVVLSLVIGTNSSESAGGTVLQQYIHQFKVGTLFELQSNVLKTERTPDLEEVLKRGLSPGIRFYDPDCSVCNDNPKVERCTTCGCSVCSLKSRPEAQLLCDECDRPTHFECLLKPLTKVPENEDEDWYCDQCRTETAKEVEQKQREHLKKKRGDGKEVRGNWGFGMSTAARKISSASQPQFGAIEGVPVGAWWRFRVQASAAGVHRPLVSGVDGSFKKGGGIYSIVFSGARAEDVDLGEELYYSLTGEQQSQALALNCTGKFNWRKGLPVRVLRNGNSRKGQKDRSLYLPKVGVRYDGLYKVVSYWKEEDSRVWRFHLRRDDPAPAPWTEAGRYRSKKAGYQVPHYPDGWTTEMAGKRRLAVDLKMVERKKKIKRVEELPLKEEDKKSTWTIPKEVEALIKQDTAVNQRQWTELRQLAKERGKEAFFNRLAETFICIVCLEPLTSGLEPVTLPTCGHVLCRRCLQRTIEDAALDCCPLCRSTPLTTAKGTRILEEILHLLLKEQN